FGKSNSDYKSVVAEFYSAWEASLTQLSSQQQQQHRRCEELRVLLAFVKAWDPRAASQLITGLAEEEVLQASVSRSVLAGLAVGGGALLGGALLPRVGNFGLALGAACAAVAYAVANRGGFVSLADAIRSMPPEKRTRLAELTVDAMRDMNAMDSATWASLIATDAQFRARLLQLARRFAYGQQTADEAREAELPIAAAASMTSVEQQHQRAGGVRCYYELLEVERQATDDELKKAYRRLALRWHPDKNPDRVEEATAHFRLVQKAYETLSDPQERAWYDKHRERILKGGLGRGDAYQEEQFGRSDSPYDTVVRPFYAHWETFFTRKSYVWVEKYDTREAPNKYARKAMEKENRAARDAARRERNEEIRTLVAFVKKRDPRVRAERRRLEARAREVEAKAKAMASAARKAHLETASRYRAPDWARTDDLEAELAKIEAEHGAGASDLDDDGDWEDQEDGGEEGAGVINGAVGAAECDEAEEADEDEDDAEDALVCVVCEKAFRTPGAKQSHDRSKRHRERLELLKLELAKHDAQPVEKDPAAADNDSLDNDEDVQLEAEVQQVSGGKKKKSKRKQQQRQQLQAQLGENEEPSDNPNANSAAAKPAEDAAEASDDEAAAAATPETSKKPRRRKDRQRQKQQELLEQKRQEQLEEEADGTTQVCKTCRQWFDSKNQLFKHLKESGHAAIKPGAAAGRTDKKSKRKSSLCFCDFCSQLHQEKPELLKTANNEITEQKLVLLLSIHVKKALPVLISEAMRAQLASCLIIPLLLLLTAATSNIDPDDCGSCEAVPSSASSSAACRCDADCQQLGDCCSDAAAPSEFVDQQQLSVSCQPLSLWFNASSGEGLDNVGLAAVDSCPPGSQHPVDDLCRHGPALPVLSVGDAGRPFRNPACAVCHRRRFELPTSDASPLQLRPCWLKMTADCPNQWWNSTAMSSAASSNVDPRLWRARRLVRDACIGGPFSAHRGGLDLLGGPVYRNKHCALCHQVLLPVCQPGLSAVKFAARFLRGKPLGPVSKTLDEARLALTRRLCAPDGAYPDNFGPLAALVFDFDSLECRPGLQWAASGGNCSRLVLTDWTAEPAPDGSGNDSAALADDSAVLVIDGRRVLGPLVLASLVLAPLVLAPLVLAPLVLAPLVLAPLVLKPLVLKPLVATLASQHPGVETGVLQGLLDVPFRRGQRVGLEERLDATQQDLAAELLLKPGPVALDEAPSGPAGLKAGAADAAKNVDRILQADFVAADNQLQDPLAQLRIPAAAQAALDSILWFRFQGEDSFQTIHNPPPCFTFSSCKSVLSIRSSAASNSAPPPLDSTGDVVPVARLGVPAAAALEGRLAQLADEAAPLLTEAQLVHKHLDSGGQVVKQVGPDGVELFHFAGVDHLQQLNDRQSTGRKQREQIALQIEPVALAELEKISRYIGFSFTQAAFGTRTAADFSVSNRFILTPSAVRTWIGTRQAARLEFEPNWNRSCEMLSSNCCPSSLSAGLAETLING
uniref:DnaJ homolog subfamily C member 21 n=1 Tax=Macrostomum lignano TaxID=282301 RepID=A0A1I8ITM0_9PLAT